MSNQLQTLEQNIYSLEANFTQLTASYDEMIVFKKEAQFAMQALQKNDYLMSTAVRNPNSLKNAILNIASVGLSLNPAEKAAYLVPRDGQVVLDISYMGLSDLASSSGSIKYVDAELVCENDNFKYNGVGLKPTHEFNPFGNRGEVIGVYCVASLLDGTFKTEMMSKEECHAIRNRTDIWKKKQAGPWKTDEGEMMKKTVIKRASKLWPKASKDRRLYKAIDVLNEHEGINFEEEQRESDEQIKKAREEAAERQRIEREEKYKLLDDIKNICAQQTQGMTLEQKGNFMVEAVGVSSFNDLARQSNESLQNLIEKLNTIEV